MLRAISSTAVRTGPLLLATRAMSAAAGGKIKNVVIIGSGQMGGGIGMVCASGETVAPRACLRNFVLFAGPIFSHKSMMSDLWHG
jgi:hypothetical protein